MAEEVVRSGNFCGMDWKVTDRGELLLGGDSPQVLDTRGLSLRPVGSNKLPYPWITSDYEEGIVTSYDSSGYESYSDGYATYFMVNSDIKSVRAVGDVKVLGPLSYMFFTWSSSTLGLRPLPDWYGENHDSNLEKVDLSRFDMSDCTDTSNMFFNCKNLKHVDLSFDLSSVECAKGMFAKCSELRYVSDLKMDNLKAARDMFKWVSLNRMQLGGIEDLSKCDMLGMFDMSHIEELKFPDAKTGFDLDKFIEITTKWCHKYTSKIVVGSMDEKDIIDIMEHAGAPNLTITANKKSYNKETYNKPVKFENLMNRNVSEVRTGKDGFEYRSVKMYDSGKPTFMIVPPNYVTERKVDGVVVKDIEIPQNVEELPFLEVGAKKFVPKAVSEIKEIYDVSVREAKQYANSNKTEENENSSDLDAGIELG